MANVFKNLKNMIGMDDNDNLDEETYYDVDADEGEEAASSFSQPAATETPKRTRSAFSAFGGSQQAEAASNLQVVLVKPEKFEDARGIADHLNMKKTVVLNLESTNKETSRRLIDFLSGVAYANSGRLQNIASNTFIIIPYNVEMSGTMLGDLESSGMVF